MRVGLCYSVAGMRERVCSLLMTKSPCIHLLNLRWHLYCDTWRCHVSQARANLSRRSPRTRSEMARTEMSRLVRHHSPAFVFVVVPRCSCIYFHLLHYILYLHARN